MENMNENFFDDVFQEMLDAFDEQYRKLGEQLEEAGESEYLNTFRNCKQEAIDALKGFKLRTLSCLCVYEEIEGWMVEKPFVYNKEFNESISSRVPRGLLFYRLNKYQCSYLPLAMECFYWGQHKYDSLEKKEGCRVLLDAFVFISYCVAGDDSRKSPKYYSLKNKFEYADKKQNSRKGGMKRHEHSNNLKTWIKEYLKKYVPEGGWITKKDAIDAFLSYLEKEYPKWWRDNPNSLHETITTWASGDLKAEFDEAVIRKNNIK
ncbi:hypothetical protein [Budvicia aquatica]|uniref:Uncharacterized protein n=1 Tax=Budvicia aquatica TaxID=82979 RepID=A0A2C6DSC3_9GAMM|nr:hypothetical protein [Budvicia aquatica]PHI31711.1 hypothetical protein CRN84_21450 [Budvicia aquatica]VFS52525.1 Uncharacterised protein [Budvicia aquatica]